MSNAVRKLFFVGENPYFPATSLFELRDEPLLTIPDRGDGSSVGLDRSMALECPAFAENVPPGQCPVRVTSFSVDDIARKIDEITFDESIHFQIIAVPLNVVSAVIYDRILGVEVESYFPSPSDDADYRMHIGHLRPGFYEAMITLAGESRARVTFIKFFPHRFSESYPEIAATANKILQTPQPIYLEDRSYQPELLNKALELATEWGENFRKPIHDRLRRFYPSLSDAEIDDLKNLVTTAESRIYAIAEMELEGKISEFDIVNTVLAEFPWMTEANAARLKNIGMYYARR